MVTIHGRRPYGTCDAVPELFYVATFFFHIDYIPLVPVSSYLFLGKKQGSNYQVVKIPFNFKSILLAWLRTATFFMTVTYAIIACVELNDRGGRNGENGAMTNATWAAASATAYAFFMIYPRKRKPSYEKACKYAQLAKLDDIRWAALNVLYGREIDERPMSMQNPLQVQ